MMKDQSTEFGSGPKEMSVTTAWVTGRLILRSVCEGQANIEDAVRLLKQIGDQPVPPQSCLVLNLLGVSGNMAFSARYELGIATAKALAKFRRVAIVQEARPDDGFGALVASNRGVHIAVFRSEADAMNWLS